MIASRRAHVAAWSAAALFAIVFGSGLFRGFQRIGVGDWDVFNTWSLIARRAIVEHHELPLWDPFDCGGHTMVGNFQSRVGSPSLLLVLAFGPIAGNHLWALCALALGFEGSRRLARELGASPIGSIFAAFAVAGNGGIAIRLAVGHLADLPYLWIPWYLLCVRRTWAAARVHIPPGACIVALSLVEGGLYPVVYMSMLGAMWSVVHAIETRRWRMVLAPVAIAIAGFALSAAVELPSLLYLGHRVRSSVDAESVPWRALAPIFFSPDQSLDKARTIAGLQWRWHEYGTYVGVLFPIAVFAGLWKARRESIAFAAFAALFFAIALGSHGRASPWELLHHLPVFASMRASGRVFLIVIVCLSIVAAFGVERFGRVAPWFTAAFALSLACVSIPLVFKGFPPVFPGEPTGAPFVQRLDLRHRASMVRFHFTTMMQDVQRNVGILDCYDPIRPNVAAEPTQGDRDEPFVVGPGRASIVERSFNHVTIALDGVSAESVVVLNANFDSGWEVVDDGVAGSFGGKLAANVPTGARSVTLAFRPISALVGLVVSLLTALVLLRMRRAPSASAAGP